MHCILAAGCLSTKILISIIYRLITDYVHWAHANRSYVRYFRISVAIWKYQRMPIRQFCESSLTHLSESPRHSVQHAGQSKCTAIAIHTDSPMAIN